MKTQIKSKWICTCCNKKLPTTGRIWRWRFDKFIGERSGYLCNTCMRMKQEEINQIFNLLYKLDDHCEKFLSGRDNETAAAECINILQMNGFFKGQ